ncbi:HK97 family phage prohead protease [Tabrizicola fusiformis]|uniref:HK97 family phage prohead protease n=1 Tax=Tabrizicola sp. SY72 TaxID=2741673 RepID=UPI001F50D314|nr:HK97 family phage prohead protease [Tabrizicola sp. SY72]
MRPATFNAEARTIEAIVSTGAAVARPGYTEVLDLRGVDLARLVGAPVLDGRRRDTTRDQLGMIEAARMTSEGLLVVIRFRESTQAQAVMTDVANGTLRGLSIGYTIEQTREAKDGTKRVRTATRWTPIEVSIVPVPADPGAHFRNGEVTMPTTENEVQVQTRAEMNTEIRSIAELAGLDRAWTDAQIDAGSRAGSRLRRDGAAAIADPHPHHGADHVRPQRPGGFRVACRGSDPRPDEPGA